MLYLFEYVLDKMSTTTMEEDLDNLQKIWVKGM